MSASFKNDIRAAATALLLAAAPALWANHPVLLEGNCNNPPAGDSAATAGVCGDFDGDGRIGVDEDMDGDRVFGTIGGANGSAGANNNGTITIVTSGTFAESVTLSGNITLQAAPGVDANIDAVLQGDSASGARQGMPGILVDAPSDRYAVIRNIDVRNWTAGIMVNGLSRVLIEDCTIEHNINYGVLVGDSAQAVITGTSVVATGRRVNPGTGDFPTSMSPSPGNGIEFADSSGGAVFGSTVTGSVNIGVAVNSNRPFSIRVHNQDNVVFGNGRDLSRGN